MTISQRWWVRKKRKEIKKYMNYIDYNLNIFAYRKQQSFGGNPRNGTMDLSMRKSYKLKGEPRKVFGPSQATFADIMIDLEKASDTLTRFIRRYK